MAWKALYDIKVFRVEVAVESALRGGKPQNAIIRVGHSLRVVHGVTLPPNHFLIDSVLQHFHGAEKHDASEESPVTKVNAGFRVVLILPCAHGGGVGGEVEDLDAFPFPGRQHGFRIRIALFINRADECHFLMVNEISDCCFRVFHCCFPDWDGRPEELHCKLVLFIRTVSLNGFSGNCLIAYSAPGCPGLKCGSRGV